MVTRKRQKLLDSQTSLNLELSIGGYQFDPILESIAQFFHLRDCVNISSLNHSYHNKTWLYILKSSNRLQRLNGVIILDHKSLSWIYKYRLHLKHQNIQISNKVGFDLSVIPQLCSLNVYSDIFTFPVQVKHLALSGFSNVETFPNVVGVETLFLPHYDPDSSLLMTSPQSIKTIQIQTGCSFNCQDLPHLQHVETLFVRVNFLINVAFIQEKLPNLTTLHLILNNVRDIDKLHSFRHKIIIESQILQTTGMFAHFQCSELDLSQCINIHDYSGITHIPIVIKNGYYSYSYCD